MAPDLTNILERLGMLEQQNERLHRQNYRLKWAGVIGVIVVTSLGLSSCQSKGPVLNGTVEAEKFVLKDAKGRVQGHFSTSQDGPLLLLFDPNEKAKPRAGIVATKDGPTLSMYDPAGKERLRVGCGTPGPGIVLLSEEGKPRVGITATEKGASIELIDESRRAEFSLPLESQRLAFFENGSPRMMLTAVNNASGLSLIGTDKSAVFLENSADAQRLMILNNKEVPRVGLAVTPQGPALGLFDEKGRVLFSKP